MPRTTYTVSGVFQLEGHTYMKLVEDELKNLIADRTGSRRAIFEVEQLHEERIVRRELGLSREEKEHLLRGIKKLLATDSMAGLFNAVDALCDGKWEIVHRMIAELGVTK